MVGRFSLFAVLAVAVVAEEPKITSGVAAAAGEFPYQVSLRINGRHACSGAIVGYQHIVTSAKCVNDVNIDDLVVVTGSTSKTDGGQNHAIKKIIVSPEFNAQSSNVNDIAVVALKSRVTYNPNQNIVFLPSHGTPGGAPATLSGWATFSDSSDVESLQKLFLKTISTEECQRNEPKVVDGHEICASVGTGLGRCMFDFGSPLVSDGALVGVLSYGNACGEGIPAIFTSVNHHVKWILKVVGEE